MSTSTTAICALYFQNVKTLIKPIKQREREDDGRAEARKSTDQERDGGDEEIGNSRLDLLKGNKTRYL